MTAPHRQHPPVRYASAVALVALFQIVLPAFAKGKSYKVRNGDNLWTIARRYDLHVKDIVTQNGISPKTELQPGQMLRLPGTARVIAAQPPKLDKHPKLSRQVRISRPRTAIASGPVYLVQKGDNPWTIARRFNVGTDNILRANGLNDRSVLQLGDRIIVPGLRPKPVVKARPPVKKAMVKVVKRGTKPSGYVVVTRNRIPLYSQTNISSDRLRVVGRGRRLATIGKKGGWVKILLADGGVAWLQSQFAYREGARTTIAQRPPAQVRPVIWKEKHEVVLAPAPRETTDEASNEAPKTEESQFIRMLADKLKQDPRASEQVAETSEKLMGLAKDMNETDSPVENDSPGNAKFAKQGLRYLGTRYRRGGLSSRGMDCSGLVVKVLRDYGIDAPHNAAALFGKGRPIGKSELEPGDLVFFRNTYRRGVSHVGIYLGETKFVHASTRGHQVRVSSLNESYYQNHWAGARRIR